jgi:hypothetical protein
MKLIIVMEINGHVYCFFEQSGVIKNEFKKLGYDASDWDIQNNFGETDHVIDLFAEIEKAWDEQPSIFDTIDAERDFVMAFFPCIEFSCVAQMWYSLGQRDYAKWPYKKRIEYMVNKNRQRARLYELVIKFTVICLDRGIRMVMENPWSEQTYLKQNVFLKNPSLIDKDRTRRGDYMKKPTAYWFWNCEPTNGYSYQQTSSDKVRRIIEMKKNPVAGMCSEERSMISPDYARNFICDFILGKEQQNSQLTLF